jgi:ParB-like chromosome segregation protein Spo0J
MMQNNEPANNDNPITWIPHSQLVMSDLNPRKQARDAQSLLELVENIAKHGVLHNLTARPKGKAATWQSHS